MTILYKVFTCDSYGAVQWGDNFKSFEEAEEYIKKNKWIGNPPFIIAERIPERVFPETSLTEDEVLNIYNNADGSFSSEALIAVANAAIKQYILDSEGGSNEIKQSLGGGVKCKSEEQYFGDGANCNPKGKKVGGQGGVSNKGE